MSPTIALEQTELAAIRPVHAPLGAKHDGITSEHNGSLKVSQRAGRRPFERSFGSRDGQSDDPGTYRSFALTVAAGRYNRKDISVRFLWHLLFDTFPPLTLI